MRVAAVYIYSFYIYKKLGGNAQAALSKLLGKRLVAILDFLFQLGPVSCRPAYKCALVFFLVYLLW